MTRILTMEERLQTEAQYIGAAHGADWRDVNPAGDLLYVGSSACVGRRLKPSQHIMWTVTNRRPELHDVRVAVWITDDYENTESALTALCMPLWSDCAGPLGDWRPPVSIALPQEMQALDAPGVYAWVLLPRSSDFTSIMLDGAASRRLRKKPAPTVHYCFSCYYASLSATTSCRRCGYMHTTKKARAQVTKVFDSDDE